MAGENITITIEDGKYEIDSSGYIGGACIKDMDKLVEYLKSIGIDASIKDRKMKAESMLNEPEKQNGHLVKR